MLVLFTGSASAHEGAGVSGGFLSGFMHPILGRDHVVRMVAVGLWDAFLGSPAIWILPVVFPLVMAFGGAPVVYRLAMRYPERISAIITQNGNAYIN